MIEVSHGLAEGVPADVHDQVDGLAAAALTVVVVELLSVDTDVLAVHLPLVRVVAVLYAAERPHGVFQVDAPDLRHQRLVVPRHGRVVPFQIAHPLLQDHDVGLGLRHLPLVVRRLHQGRVQRRRDPLGDALGLLAGPSLGVAHEAARPLHLKGALDDLRRRRRLHDLGVERAHGLVLGHAPLDAPLKPQGAHGGGIAILHARQQGTPPRVRVGVEPPPLVNRYDEGLDMGRLLVLVQDGRDDVALPVGVA